MAIELIPHVVRRNQQSVLHHFTLKKYKSKRSVTIELSLAEASFIEEELKRARSTYQ